MASGLLYTPPKYFRAQRVEIAAQYSNFKLQLAKYSPGSTDAALAKKGFPEGHLPAFESGKDVKLFEANAIAHFVATDQLRGGDSAATKSHIVQFESWSSANLVPAALSWVLPTLGVVQDDKQRTEAAKKAVKTALTYLNEHLKTRTYLVGERITLADIAVTCDLLLLYQNVLEPSFRAPFNHVNRWFVTIVNQPEVKKVLGDVKLAEKMAVFDGAKYQELHKSKPQQQQQQKGGKGKKEQPQQQPKQEKPKPKDDDDDEAAKKKSEDKDPFLKFPAGSFIMDEWKRTYSNNDIKTVALPYFWDKFDTDHYSIWYCEYKFPEELRMIFMSCNLVGGFFQRLDRMRKHAFGSMIVFGENMNATISGIWIWRGQDLCFTLHEDLQIDYESYNWTKLDAKSAETKTMVEEYFLHEGNFVGKKFNQGKIFK